MKRVGVTCPHCGQTFPKYIPEKRGGTSSSSCSRCGKHITIKYKDGAILEVRK